MRGSHQQLKRPKSGPDLVALHRCRFVNWCPAPIVSIDASADGSVVALVRDGGDIELWDVASWSALQRIPGRNGSVLSSVKVVSDGQRWRVFTGGLDGVLAEVDFKATKEVAATDSFGGAVWAMAMQPVSKEGEPRRMAVGCDDGVVRLFTPAVDDGGLEYSQSLPKVDSRVLCVAWHPRGEVVVTGGSDGCIRAWHVSSCRELIRITAGDGSGASDLCIWSLTVLPDGTIVSGDSQGNVSFWDGQFGTLLHQLTPHAGDVLTLAATPDGSRVFSGGMDAQVVMLRRTVMDGDVADWVIVDRKRGHSHDVRALAIVPRGEEQGGAVLLSGGNDTQLLAYHANSFHKDHPVRVCKVSQLPTLVTCTAKASPLLLCAQHNTLELWQLGQYTLSTADVGQSLFEGLIASPDSPPQLLLRLKKKGTRAITAAAMSPDGQCLTWCDAEGLTLYRLAYSSEQHKSSPPVALDKVDLSPLDLQPLTCLAFTGNSKQLVAASGDGTVYCIHLHKEEVGHTFHQVRQAACASLNHAAGSTAAGPSTLAPASSIAAAATVVTCSANGRWAAVADRCSAHVFDVEGGGYVGRTALLEGDTSISTMCFSPSSDHLMVGTADRQLLLYEIPALKEAAWSVSHASHGSPRIAGMTGPIIHISFKPNQERLGSCLVSTPSSLCHIDLSLDPAGPSSKDGSRKRARSARKPNPTPFTPPGVNYRVLHLTDPALHLAFTSTDSALLVERPWSEVWKSLPQPLYRHRFGT